MSTASGRGCDRAGHRRFPPLSPHGLAARGGAAPDLDEPARGECGRPGADRGAGGGGEALAPVRGARAPLSARDAVPLRPHARVALPPRRRAAGDILRVGASGDGGRRDGLLAAAVLLALAGLRAAHRDGGVLGVQRPGRRAARARPHARAVRRASGTVAPLIRLFRLPAVRRGRAGDRSAGDPL